MTEKPIFEILRDKYYECARINVIWNGKQMSLIDAVSLLDEEPYEYKWIDAHFLYKLLNGFYPREYAIVVNGRKNKIAIRITETDDQIIWTRVRVTMIRPLEDDMTEICEDYQDQNFVFDKAQYHKDRHGSAAGCL